MTVAYVDTSVIVAVLLGQPGGRQMTQKLRRLEAVFSANLLEAELRSVLAREKIDASLAAPALRAISWVFPRRPLTPEIMATLSAGYCRGADLWHLACALYVAQTPEQVAFLSLDKGQKQIATRLGFAADI